MKRATNIRLVLVNGRTLITKFVEKRSTHIVTEDGKFMNEDVKSATILRGK